MDELKPCPNPACKSTDLRDCYVYIRCNKCGMTGPQRNQGRFDDHSDFMDHEGAVKDWNNLPRADGWVSVEERLPEENVQVWAYIKNGDHAPAILRPESDTPSGWCHLFACEFWEEPNHGVTHWRPLPDPPEEG